MKQRSIYPWVCVGLLWFVWLLNYLDRQIIFSVFPLLRAELHLSDRELGLTGTAFLWVYAFASPLSGHLADRFGRKRMIVISAAIWSAVTFATGLARNLPELLAARALMGISEACYLPAGLALIAAWHRSATRAKATGLHYSGGYLGMVLGGWLGGRLAQAYGWRPGFWILGGAGVVYALILQFALREPDTPAEKVPDFWRSTRDVFKLPGYTTMFIVFAMISVGNWVCYTWLPLYLYESFHMDLADAGFTGTFYLQLGGITGVLLGGAIADRWVARNPRARLLTQSISLAAAAPFLFLSGFTSKPAILVIGIAAFGICRGVYDANCMPALCQIAPDRLRSTGFGLFNFIGPFTGGIVAAGAGELKSSIGIGGSLEIAGVILGLSALLLARVRIAAQAETPALQGLADA